MGEKITNSYSMFYNAPNYSIPVRVKKGRWRRHKLGYQLPKKVFEFSSAYFLAEQINKTGTSYENNTNQNATNS